MTVYAQAGHDDRLFLTLANDLINGQWLGPYNDLTLAKGPFYSIWIVLSFISGLPLLISEQIFYIFSVICLILAVRPVLDKFSLTVLYAVLLFNPISFADGPMTRVIREGIYPALTLLVIACSFGLFIRREQKKSVIFLWSLLLGISFSCFWLTREEGIWILPLVAVVCAWMLILLFKGKKNKHKHIIIVSLVPISVWGLSILTVSAINDAKYGVFNVVEFRSNDFVKAYSSLTRVKVNNWNPVVPVSKEAREQIYQVSPLFGQLEPFLEGDLGSEWIKSGARGTGEIEGGWFMWALREAVKKAGYYQDGRTAENFYHTLANQINTACDSGELQCGPPTNSMQPPWNKKYIKPLFQTVRRSVNYFISFSGFSATASPSIGDTESFVLFEDLTNSNKKAIERQTIINGWAFHETDPITLKVLDKNNEVLKSQIIYSNSDDVFKYFSEQGKNFNTAMNSRFKLITACNEDCTLSFNNGTKILGTLPLDGVINSLENDKLHVYLDSVSIGGTDLSNQYKLDHMKSSILSFIGKAYQLAVPPLTVLSFLILLLSLYLTAKKRLSSFLSVTSLLLIGTIFIRLVMLSMIDISSFPAISVLYLSSAYPLLLLYIVISVTSIRQVYMRFKR
ncbi:hypothetical protein [Cohnella sp. GbtcB17]|uniref:hypothetical protein n=1 Tax=Cohnella sp. GbtcB17 TaxID=2824762 RepID=UPI001C2F5F7C|nr:hypothetical protein [Cohnella sp. GbtcB17]